MSITPTTEKPTVEADQSISQLDLHKNI